MPAHDSNVRRRTIGPDGPSVSQIAYGAMRMRGDVAAAAALLLDLHERGITTHHSSHEYDSHGLYLDSVREARRTGVTFEHIVKLSSPSFDSARFSAGEMGRLVENELRTLGTEQLASVQWLVRTPDAQDLDARLSILDEQAEEIHDCFDRLLINGDIGDVSIFTYHPDFGRRALEIVATRTLCDYLNRTEIELVPLLETVDSFLALRPLAAGALTDADDQIADALRWPLLHPKVATIIMSINQPHHVDQAIASAGTVVPDEFAFTAGLNSPT